jgi:hypothetical protein
LDFIGILAGNLVKLPQKVKNLVRYDRNFNLIQIPFMLKVALKFIQPTVHFVEGIVLAGWNDPGDRELVPG